jgi:hypothetical protein
VKKKERERGIYALRERTILLRSPFHFCMRAPEWNSLCRLVERERKGKGRRKIALFKRVRSFQDPQGIPFILRKSQLQVLLIWLAIKALSRHLCASKRQSTLTSYVLGASFLHPYVRVPKWGC